MNTFAYRVLGARILNPTPLTWVYLIPTDEAIQDFLASGATDQDKCWEVQKNCGEFCVYSTADIPPKLLTGMGTVWELSWVERSDVLVVVVTQTTYEDGTGGTNEPSTVETTEDQIALRTRRLR